MNNSNKNTYPQIYLKMRTLSLKKPGIPPKPWNQKPSANSNKKRSKFNFKTTLFNNIKPISTKNGRSTHLYKIAWQNSKN